LKLLYILLLVPFMVYPVFAAEYDQIVSTSDETLDVGIYTIPAIPNTDEPTKLKIDFLKYGTERIQQHVDYRVSVTNDGDYVFGPMSRLLHTSPGSITIPVEFSENGSHIVHIEMEGVLFQPIPLETATLTINVGQAETSIPGWIKNNAGWWADGMIDDASFVSGIQWLISNGVMNIPPTEQGTGSDDVIPGWIKNNAGWWADGQIDDSSFVSGLQWLISNGIMILTQETADPELEAQSADYFSISSPPNFEKYFAKYVDVLGVPVYATSDVPDDKVLHAAHILAQYLDNDADGTPDNPLVVEKIKANHGGVPLFSAPDVDDEILYTASDEYTEYCWVALYEDETNPRNQFDASLEEILHMITQCGYAEAYPEIFGEHEDSLIAEYMDNARGGFFDQVPSSYPAGAWYSYDDYTCEYECMITEYFYWTMTSILGAQEDRLDEIGHEWKLNTKEKVMETDPDIYNLLTDPQYKLPTIIPDGNYQG
jgi:hypothetical protein